MGSYEEEPITEEESNDDVKPSQDVEDDDDKPQRIASDIESARKLFVGGLARGTTSAEFKKHFDKYGDIIDSVIMKDKETGVPRGFGFVTFADSSVIDKVIQDTHILNGKEVEVRVPRPRGSNNSNERKIFVGGIPFSVNDDEFKECFVQFGEVKEHEIIRDHTSGRSRGYGFITYESEEIVDHLLEKGNRIKLGGALVELKRADPKKRNLVPLPSRWSSDSRSSFSGISRDSYGGSGGPYLSTGGYGYGGEFGGYGGGYGSGVGPYRGEPPSVYSGYSGPYGGGGGSGYNIGGYGGGYGSGVGPYRGEPPSGYSGPYGRGGGSDYNIGGYGVGGSGGPYGAYVGPNSSYGGGYGTAGSGFLGAYGGAGTEGYNSYGGGPGAMYGAPYGGPSAGSEGGGGGRGRGGGGRRGGGGSSGGGADSEGASGGGRGGGERYDGSHPYGR